MDENYYLLANHHHLRKNLKKKNINSELLSVLNKKYNELKINKCEFEYILSEINSIIDQIIIKRTLNSIIDKICLTTIEK
jgi:hypothetical protein|tara:strand:+ start:280 stop:519 length:240 start_codon:yes stop_codon:yes gene_type:complete